MDRRSRSIESPRRHRSRREHRRYSRSRSRSRSRNRSREHDRRRRGSRGDSRSRSRERHFRRSTEKDLYRDIIYNDYQDERYSHSDEHYPRDENGTSGGNDEGAPGDDRFEEDRERGYEDRYCPERLWTDRSREKGRDYDRERDRDRSGSRRDQRHRHTKRYHSSERDESDGYDSDGANEHYYNQTPTNTIIIRGLAQHITETDISSNLTQFGLTAVSIRLIRKRRTGASRGFAFVEFNTVGEAASWMEYKQGTLMLQDQYRAVMQYSHSKNKTLTDWYCAKCGVFNFKRRENCFKCYASREESEKGGEGSDEVSHILTKKIMLRNLDVLTNEEGVLTALQQVVPEIVSKISKVLICRDPLTQTSRGICYLNFDSLVDSMNLHNALNALEPALKIDNREVYISYCVDSENRQVNRVSNGNKASADVSGANTLVGDLSAQQLAAGTTSSAVGQYTLADVPRLAEYSAAMYASTPAEHEHYLKYYTQYYISEISKGQYADLPAMQQLGESANSGAAVALSAIQRKQSKMKNIETVASKAAAAAAAAAAAVKVALAAQAVVTTPKGNDGKQYPTPDVSLYQYDETSGYYYDPTTGLYYDAHSQYYYNNETGAYLYWDQKKSTYILATPASAAAAIKDVVKTDASDETKSTATAGADDEQQKKDSGKKEGKPDKVKVAKKIVKDMEKWAKQLNQKKDMSYVATSQPILPQKTEETINKASSSLGGYADVGFSILEKKERTKLTDYLSPTVNKLVPSYASDSDDHEDHRESGAVATAGSAPYEANEKDYVDFQKLTCLLCKRAFQSLDILTKHLKMSNLHKENLQKYNLSRGNSDLERHSSSLSSYRDRAKERRLKYGESDPPPPNRSKERFEKEIQNITSAASNKPNVPSMPIGQDNVGNRLLQKMGWSEGQGLGRKNQGRTNIIEADTRNTTAGLGTKSTPFVPGEDYKTYIKKMMKSRYEQVQ